jgi:molybdopterin adenylyltransferase
MTTVPVPIGIVVCSDRAARGTYEDRGGPAIESYLRDVLATPWRPILAVISDERELIAGTIAAMVDVHGCPLVLTTGGTGPSARDVTPEATMDVCPRLLPGFGEVMRQASLRDVPTAILSRQSAGLRGAALVINLPGKPASIRTCLDAVFPAVPYCIELAGGPRLDTHPALCRAFRPAA